MRDRPDNTNLLRIHHSRLIQRDIDQLLGICEFALLDGLIDTDEASAILEWLLAHPSCLDTWPANVLHDKLQQILADGRIDDTEQHDLLELIMHIAVPRRADGHRPPSSLPLDQPEPPIIFSERNFCFTGNFEFGTRHECQSAVVDRGGNVLDGITKKLHYLVIGAIGSEAWRHTSFGSKIAKAVEYRERGTPIAIVSEHHWAATLR